MDDVRLQPFTDEQLDAIATAMDGFAVGQIQGFHYPPEFVIRDCLRPCGQQVVWRGPDTIDEATYRRQCDVERLPVAIAYGLANSAEPFASALSAAEARGRAAGLEEAAAYCAAQRSASYGYLRIMADEAAEDIRALAATPPEPPALDVAGRTEGGL
jgi:hypothetical protein